MVITVLDAETRKNVKFANQFISLIWTERYQEYGDFELELVLNEFNWNLFKIDRYLQISTSENLMIIEKVEISGTTLKISGRSLESLLDRRIIDTEYITNTSVGERIASIINRIHKNAWVGNENRLVDYISTDDVPDDIATDKDRILLKGYTVSRGDNVYDVIVALSLVDDLGFRYIFDPISKSFSFQLYTGTKRDNVVLSESNYNVKSVTYKEDNQTLKTTAYVAGEGEGTKRKIVTVSRTTTVKDENNLETTNITYSGIFRRELWVDARDLQKTDGEKNADYLIRLKDRGVEKLSEKNKNYDADCETFNTPKYKLGTDYSLGDIVSLKSKYFNASARITEVIQSWSGNEYSMYPTFKVVSINTSEVEESFNLS